jgi:hypothetical protein
MKNSTRKYQAEGRCGLLIEECVSGITDNLVPTDNIPR